MFFDPQCKPEVKPEVRSNIYALSTLIAWLETMPSAMEYNFGDCRGMCLLGQYMAAHGTPWHSTIGDDDAYCLLERKTMWGLNIAIKHPQTFGAALERARALQS